MMVIQREDVDNVTIHIDDNQKLAVKLNWEEPRQFGFPVSVGFKNGQLTLKEDGTETRHAEKSKYFLKTYTEKFHSKVPYISIQEGYDAQEFGNYPDKFPKKRDIDSDGKRHISYAIVDVFINANGELKGFGANVVGSDAADPRYIDMVRPIGWFKESVNELPAFTEEFMNQLDNAPAFEMVHPDYPNLKLTYETGANSEISVTCQDTSAFNLETESFDAKFAVALIHTTYGDDGDYNPTTVSYALNAPAYPYPKFVYLTLKATEEEKKRQQGAYEGIYNPDTETVTWGHTWG
jgi:hypothetical protein|nr:MAG TPA: hypothetical protein [Caudoviricetes sp.]